ncbi:MAG: glycosyltransferase [Acidimicrobiales bacterium]
MVAVPSRFEGFGAPALEAMAAGVPVVVADATALPWVVGGAGLKVRPGDPAQWASALARVLDQPTVARTLAEAGQVRPALHLGSGGGRPRRELPRQRPAWARLARHGALLVLCPHFAPDVAPTGEVMTQIGLELAALGNRLHVVTSLPWYQHHAIEPGWEGQVIRHEDTEWGRITRVHPFPTDKRNIPARAAAFAGFTALTGLAGLVSRSQPDAVLAMSPPLTLGAAGWAIARAHRVPFVFNIQDVFPDVAVELGAITDPKVIAVASWLERETYLRADAVTVLSEDLKDNVAAKIAGRRGVAGSPTRSGDRTSSTRT